LFIKTVWFIAAKKTQLRDNYSRDQLPLNICILCINCNNPHLKPYTHNLPWLKQTI
jgi:hypothetical protein